MWLCISHWKVSYKIHMNHERDSCQAKIFYTISKFTDCGHPPLQLAVYVGLNKEKAGYNCGICRRPYPNHQHGSFRVVSLSREPFLTAVIGWTVSWNQTNCLLHPLLLHEQNTLATILCILNLAYLPGPPFNPTSSWSHAEQSSSCLFVLPSS